MDDSGQHIVPKEITISEVEAAIERTGGCERNNDELLEFI